MNIQCTSYTVGSHDLALNDEYRLLFIDRELLKLTPTEYQLIRCFIDGVVAQDETLVSRAIKGAPTNTVNLEKHITNLRTKIRRYGLGIYRVRDYGYVLVERK